MKRLRYDHDASARRRSAGRARDAPVPNAVLAGTSAAVSSSGALSLSVSCPAGESQLRGHGHAATLGAVMPRAPARRRRSC